MNLRHRRAACIFFGLFYVALSLLYSFFPFDVFGGMSTVQWVIATRHVGDPIMNAIWIITPSLGFFSAGLIMIISPFLRRSTRQVRPPS